MTALNGAQTSVQNVDKYAQKRLLDQEIELQMNMRKDRSLHRSELIFELRKIHSLASLHHSLVISISIKLIYRLK